MPPESAPDADPTKTPVTAAAVRERAVCLVAGVLHEAPTPHMTTRDFDRLAEVIVSMLQEDGWTHD